MLFAKNTNENHLHFIWNTEGDTNMGNSSMDDIKLFHKFYRIRLIYLRNRSIAIILFTYLSFYLSIYTVSYYYYYYWSYIYVTKNRFCDEVLHFRRLNLSASHSVNEVTKYKQSTCIRWLCKAWIQKTSRVSPKKIISCTKNSLFK